MNFSNILKQRRALYKTAGKLEYLFFPSILISAAAICAVIVILVDGIFRSEQVRSVYIALFSSAAQSTTSLYFPSMPDYLENAIGVLYRLLVAIFEIAPTALSFFLSLTFIVCPVYQGAVRYSAYLIEENKPLPLTAVLFYFTNARLYFSCVGLSLRLAVRKVLAALVFLSPPTVCFALGFALSSTYFGQKTVAASIMLLSIVLVALSAVLYFIYCRRYFAVRYIYALGARRKIFKLSAKLSKGKTAKLFVLSLRLSLNLIPAFLVFLAPAALSRIINGQGLVVHRLLCERMQNKEKSIT